MITDEADLPVAAEEVLRIGLLEAALVDDYCRRVLRFRCRDASRPVFYPLVGIGKAAVHEAGSRGAAVRRGDYDARVGRFHRSRCLAFWAVAAF